MASSSTINTLASGIASDRGARCTAEDIPPLCSPHSEQKLHGRCEASCECEPAGCCGYCLVTTYTGRHGPGANHLRHRRDARTGWPGGRRRQPRSRQCAVTIARRGLGDTTVGSARDSVTNLLGLNETLERANRFAAYLEEDAPLNRALARKAQSTASCGRAV